MPNQADPGIAGGSAEPGGSGSTATSAQAEEYSETSFDEDEPTSVLGRPTQDGPARPEAGTAHDGPGGAAYHAFHGRPVSWVAVALILIGFLAGGLAIVFDTWPVFWAGVGVAAVGCLVATAFNLFDDWY